MAESVNQGTVAKVLVERTDPLRHVAVRMPPEKATGLLNLWLCPHMATLDSGAVVAVNDVLAFEGLDGTKYGMLRSSLVAISFKTEAKEAPADAS